MAYLMVRMSGERKARIKSVAAEKQISMSAFTRLALGHAVDDHMNRKREREIEKETAARMKVARALGARRVGVENQELDGARLGEDLRGCEIWLSRGLVDGVNCPPSDVARVSAAIDARGWTVWATDFGNGPEDDATFWISAGEWLTPTG